MMSIENVEMPHCQFHLKAEHFPAALVAIRQAVQAKKDDGSLPSMASAIPETDLREALINLGFEPGIDLVTGDIIDFPWETRDFISSVAEIAIPALAPFVEPGSFIEFHDGVTMIEHWRWVFQDGECHKEVAVIAWPMTLFQLIEQDLAGYEETLMGEIQMLYENQEDDPPAPMPELEQLSYLTLLAKHMKEMVEMNYDDGDVDDCIKYARREGRLQAYAEVAEKLYGITQREAMPPPSWQEPPVA